MGRSLASAAVARSSQNFAPCCCAIAMAALRHCSASVACCFGWMSNISALKRSNSGSYHRSPVVDATSSAASKSASAPSASPAASLVKPTIPISDWQVEATRGKRLQGLQSGFGLVDTGFDLALLHEDPTLHDFGRYMAFSSGIREVPD